MNKKVKRMLAGLTMMVSVGLIAGCGTNEQVGYVDMTTIMTNSQKGQEATAKLKAKESELNARMAQAQSEGQDNNALAQLHAQSQQELSVYEQAVYNDFRNTLDTNVQAVAKEKNVTAVVNKMALVSGGVDLTEDVLNKMGKAANAGQAASSDANANSGAASTDANGNK